MSATTRFTPLGLPVQRRPPGRSSLTDLDSSMPGARPVLHVVNHVRPIQTRHNVDPKWDEMMVGGVGLDRPVLVARETADLPGHGPSECARVWSSSRPGRLRPRARRNCSRGVRDRRRRRIKPSMESHASTDLRRFPLVERVGGQHHRPRSVAQLSIPLHTRARPRFASRPLSRW